jgi:hypothetical protein
LLNAARARVGQRARPAARQPVDVWYRRGGDDDTGRPRVRGEEFPLDEVVVADVLSPAVREHEIVRLLELGAQPPSPQAGDELSRDRHCPHAGRALRRAFVRVGINPTADIELAAV